ncbi:hypothetical protein [Streptomyces alanosinicus]|uniref:Uncharacterized protein n=1 Tax=Streptomyces alanosinicus TaxID=68171 RepID=A0A918YJA7_9ACTN|nr:hypothetical protein [Streptomyces alanosinicus]GHE05068.1 hypothetical protein GCM10010339_39330 [Streptomyces alanosinicus]
MATFSRSRCRAARTGTWTVTVSEPTALSVTATTIRPGVRGARTGALPLTVPSAETDSHAWPATRWKAALPASLPSGLIHSPPSRTEKPSPEVCASVVTASTTACGRGITGRTRKLNGAVLARMPYPSLASRQAVYGPSFRPEVSRVVCPAAPGTYVHTRELLPLPGCLSPAWTPIQFLGSGVSVAQVKVSLSLCWGCAGEPIARVLPDAAGYGNLRVAQARRVSGLHP